MKICARSVSAVLAIIALPSVAQADESLWIYAKGAETLPKGRTEVKASVISRRGKFAFNRKGRNVDEHEKVNLALTIGFEL